MLLENPHEKHMRKSRLQKRILPHFMLSRSYTLSISDITTGLCPSLTQLETNKGVFGTLSNIYDQTICFR